MICATASATAVCIKRLGMSGSSGGTKGIPFSTASHAVECIESEAGPGAGRRAVCSYRNFH